MRPIQKTILLVILACIPAYFLLRAGPEDIERALTASDYSVPAMLLEEMPLADQLRQLGLDLRLLSGQHEQNGIFIGEGRLILNTAPADPSLVAQNTEAITRFAERFSAGSSRKFTYFAILPSAAGVLQHHLPQFAQGEVPDQQRLIEDIYNQAAGTRTVDIYSALWGRREQYIYYRTDTRLTSLGGYYAYTAIAARLQITNRSLGQFDIEYIGDDYYGNLHTAQAGAGISYPTAPYRHVQPDSISLYRYNSPREYIVSQRTPDGVRVYHTLYPEQRMELGDALDVFLGGRAGVTEITSSAPYRSTLLVFGDETAGSFLPFLANHYGKVTLVDLYSISQAELAAIQPEQYDQVLFAYGIETFVHTGDPAKVDGVGWNQ